MNRRSGIAGLGNEIDMLELLNVVTVTDAGSIGSGAPLSSGRVCVVVVATSETFPLTSVAVTRTSKAWPPGSFGQPVPVAVLGSVVGAPVTALVRSTRVTWRFLTSSSVGGVQVASARYAPPVAARPVTGPGGVASSSVRNLVSTGSETLPLRSWV